MYFSLIVSGSDLDGRVRFQKKKFLLTMVYIILFLFKKLNCKPVQTNRLNFDVLPTMRAQILRELLYLLKCLNYTYL